MNHRRRSMRLALLIGAGVVLGLAAIFWTGAQQPKSVTGESTALANDSGAPKFTNRLIDETSPYLLQHAHNPVDWHPWDEEALQKARDEDKPIFLSIGYSACHWCHVMEHESFENEEIAAMLNAHFISIKVDREERPDLDEIYMTATQIMSGSGGWPMSVFLTPDLKPFLAGTYFPPEDRWGRRGFRSLIALIADKWEADRPNITKGADQVTEYILQATGGDKAQEGAVTPDVIARAVAELKSSYDAEHGGWGGAPKFPSAPTIALLFRYYQRTGDEESRDIALHTLRKMANGGMYDHLGGGFHRYATDEIWLVPHFEKMLYDNGQLVQVYLEAHQITGDPFYRRIVEETLDYQLREMTDEAGGFHSTEDADSEGEEGKFYIWTADELNEILGDDAEVLAAYYTVRPSGNFESHESYHANQNILHVTRAIEDVAKELDLSVAELTERLAAMRAKLLEVRAERVRPGLDDKILTSWNGLMIAGMARAYQVLGDERYRGGAERAADFVLTQMMRDGELLRTHRHGESRLPAYLDDYAFTAVGLIDLYEATFDPRWLDAADKLVAKMNELFWDDADGGYFFTSASHTNLITRTKPTYDGAEPSGNSMATLALLRLAKLTDNAAHYDRAERILRLNAANLSERGRGYLVLLCAVDFYLNPPKEIAIAGAPGSPGVDALLETLHSRFVPNKVVALVDPNDGDAAATGERIPLLAAKTLIDGQAAAYVCKDFACKQPVTTPDAFARILDDEETEFSAT
jgi:uncharacterized protein